MKSLEIKGFIEASFCDWDGKISAVTFLPGCNLRCPFCQNGDLVLRHEKIPPVDFLLVRAYLARNKEWIDGVVVTGGEPTIWDELPRFLASIKALGLGVKLDTNGTRPEMLQSLIDQGLVDYIAMDVKAPLDGRYETAAGVAVDLDALRSSIAILSSSSLGDSYEFRTTLVPGLVGEDEVVGIAGSIEGARRYVLQQFIPENSLAPDLRGALPYNDDFVSRLVERARTHVRFCFFRGKTRTVLSSRGGLV